MGYIYKRFKYKKIEVNIVFLPLEKAFGGEYNNVLSFFWEINGHKEASYMRMVLEASMTNDVESLIKEYTRIVKDEIDKKLL